MKLLGTGLALLAVAVAALFADFNPATPLIGGIACTFLGVIDLIARPGLGRAVPDAEISEANSLANIQNYGSAVGSARLIER